jgi:uncharacterized membrane-anchored protein
MTFSQNNDANITHPETEKITVPLLPQIPQKTPSKPINNWRFLVPFLFQISLILSVPAQPLYTYLTGKTVILQTAPVDPYDFLRGYYQVLSYEISLSDTLENLPGWQQLPGDLEKCFSGQNCVKPSRKYVKQGISFYVILEAPKQEKNSLHPLAWKPIAVSEENPKDLPSNQIAIKGKYNGSRMIYGLETYYMPEEQRNQVNADISQVQRRQRQAFVVEAKVDNQGNAIPLSLWVRDRNYRF